MVNTAKKLILFQFNHYKDIELKLEKMAEKGLFLKKVGTLFWTFEKSEPKKVKYTVTYFSEASIFNPTDTDNQQTYYDYAKESGWNFVAQLNQMQIFSSEDESPIPFETDEKEKLENIKKCMKKNFLPSTLSMIFVFLLNLVVQYNSFRLDPIDFLAETSGLFTVAVLLPTIIYLIYNLLAYFVWCKQSESSISMGGGCIEKTHKYQKIMESVLLIYDFSLIGLFVVDMLINNNLTILILAFIHVPILAFIFSSSIKYLKKKKQSAMINRIVSYTLLTVASFGYVFFIIMVIMKFDISGGIEKPYRTFVLQMTPTETMAYKIYNEDIPLKCEDLYGNIKYDNYSYEKEVYSSILLRKCVYRQDSLPAKNSPPRIEYMIIEPKFDFVHDIVVEDLKKLRYDP